MKIILKYLFGCVVILSLSQCFKEEDPIVMPEFGDQSKVETIEMGPDYDGQYFFDLGTGLVISSNPKTAWDLAFDCDQGQFYIWLNGAKTMMISKAPTTDFDRPVDLSSLEWVIDGSGGDVDSNSFGESADFSAAEPISNGDLFIIDRGEDASGISLGTKKMQLIRFFENSYEFRYANLDGTGYGTIGVLKDDLYNFKYFSFDEGDEVLIEPFKVEWDLEFTRYTALFYAPDLLPYQVTGAMINPSKVEVAKIDQIPFEDLSIDDISSVVYSSDWDVIGYNWKDIDINSGLFSINIDRSYIIRDVSGDYYKLRFVDFYNDLGEKGYPKFEYQKL